ncbi:hypothetical protein BGW39_008820 [Mortierella sp. 14UC]|nr:hypothetical protein BGW39_008820 [Mortierella sp. 14UC]
MANTFFYASVIWGVIAPNLMFGPASMFNAINYFLVDFILPIPSDYLKKVYLNTWMYQARIPVMLAAISMVPPAKSYHYTNWLAVGLVFQYFVRKYHNAWHLRFTYVMSAAFESGAAFMGLLSFFVFTIRDVGFPIWWDFQRFHLSEAGTFFTGWAAHYLPFFFVDRVLYMHHYLPSLYFSILVTSSILPGISGFLLRPARFAVFTTLLLLTVATFLRLAPLSYGSEMSREKCEAVAGWVSPSKGYFNNLLDCSLAPWAAERPKLLSVLKKQRKADKVLSKRQRQEAKTVDDQGRPQPTKNADNPAGTTTAAAANNFMTTEPVIVLLSDTTASPSAPLLSGTGKNNRLSATKPLPKIPAPVLPMHLPPVKRRLPVPDIALLPYQRPPQLWDRETQAQMMQWEDLNLYEQLQIQQLVSGNYQKVNNDEDNEFSEEDEVVRSVDGQEQDQNQNRSGDAREDAFVQRQQDESLLGANNNNQVPCLNPLSAKQLNQDTTSKPATEADAEIDRVLSQFQEHNRQAAVLAAAAYHQIRISAEQLQIEDDEADSHEETLIDRPNRRRE